MLLGMWGHFKSIEYGEIMDFAPLLLSSGLVLSHQWFRRSYFLMFYEVHWCFLLNGGGYSLVIWNANGMLFFFVFFFSRCLLWAAAAAHTESNAVWILCLFKAALLQNYSVVHFYSGNLLGPIMIREPSLHLWTSTRVYQDLICSGLLNLIFLALH